MTRDLAYLMHFTSVLGATLKIYNFELQFLPLLTRLHPTPRAGASITHHSTLICFHQCTYFYALPPEAPYPPFFTLHIDNHYDPHDSHASITRMHPFLWSATPSKHHSSTEISASRHCVWDALEASSSSWRSVDSRFGHRRVGVKPLRARPTPDRASNGASLLYLVRLTQGHYTSESRRWI